MKIGLLALASTFATALLATTPAAAQAPSGTPAEMVATYDALADTILALDKAERNLVRSILAATLAHGRGALGRALRAIEANDARGASAAVEVLAADVAQLGTEGDGAVGAVRKRLLDGGHHHNAAGEAQGVYEEGYVVVTRAAKAKLLESARAIGGMSASPRADALAAEWKKAEAVIDDLTKGR